MENSLCITLHLSCFWTFVEWFDKDESRQMRYSPSTIQFIWLGRKLFGGRFIRFMSGPKNECDILTDLQRRIGFRSFPWR